MSKVRNLVGRGVRLVEPTGQADGSSERLVEILPQAYEAKLPDLPPSKLPADIMDFGEVYREARIEPPVHGYGIDKIESMLRQIDVTQDAVEIYYYCMLLGFKGRYGVYEQEKLLAIMQSTANSLIKAGRIKPVELSPHWLANDQPEPPKKRGMPVWAKIGAFVGLGLAFIIYLVMFLMSSKFLQDAVERLQM